MFGKSNTTRRFTRKRLLTAAGFVATLFAVVSLMTGNTFGLLSGSKTSSSNTFTAGTVSFTTTTGITCTDSGILPSSTPPSSCSLAVTYSGSAAAFVGLDVLIITDPGVGGTPLYTANSGGLTFTLSDGTDSYTVPTTAITGASCSALGGDSNATCYQATDELTEVTGPAGDAGHTSWSGTNSDTTTFTLSPSFPLGTSSAYSGGTATVTLTAHAVQSGNNGNTTSCTVGSPCANIGHWS